mmetsp:Transcript_19607/g.29779  ORF Transcript_19607/g.29779 Transcript_19607/m.29779 type:complete len:265 (-) Transcript_19607:635-1429(-)
MTSQGLNLSGKLFFSGLTAGTFGLGSWQSQRYFEKIEQMKEREIDLLREPIVYDPASATTKDDKASFRKQLIRGQFRHAQELLIGPRGPPPGALAADGPTSGRSGGGMSSGPQGYYVVTPFELKDANKTVILMNRGWIPRHFPEHDVDYDHPQGVVDVVAVPSQGENPRFMMPPHNFSKRPPRLYWMDVETMHDVTGDANGLFVAVGNTDAEEEERRYPVKPSPSTVGEFKISPFTHAGYAFTWYGLAAAGVVMTRRLITRGRM